MMNDAKSSNAVQIHDLLNRYWAWLREQTSTREAGEWVEVTTPFLDRHNDHLQIYVKHDGGHYILSDDGYIIQDLRYAGCDLASKRRQEILRTTLNGFGVQTDEDALVVHATVSDFPSRKHNLVQAMLAVNDLFYLAPATVVSLFLEDVEEWLVQHEIRFVPRVKFTGRSGYDHFFHFVIPSSRSAPERVVEAINRPTRERAESVAFAWHDTRDARAADSVAYAMLNDTENPPPREVLEALKSYDVRPVLWSERASVRAELVA